MSNAREFNVGDVVQMRSGGPLMTVREVKPEGVVCAWFDAQGVEHEVGFKPEMLGKAISQPEPIRRVTHSPYGWMRQSG